MDVNIAAYYPIHGSMERGYISIGCEAVAVI